MLTWNHGCLSQNVLPVVPGLLHFPFKELKEDTILQLPSQLDGDMAVFADLG